MDLVEDAVIDPDQLFHWVLVPGRLIYLLLRLASQLGSGSRSRRRLVLTRNTVS